MAEAMAMSLILMLRVLLVGGLFLLYPRITRKGLLFGVYVGEEQADREAARTLTGGWYRGCAIVMLISFLFGATIAFAGWPLAGNLTGTAVLLIGMVLLYFRLYFRARDLAPPTTAAQAGQSVAALGGGEPRGTGLARMTLALCLLTALATLVYALLGYQRMPDPVRALSGTVGNSLVATFFFPSLNLVLSPFFALLALFTAQAKRSLRGGSGGGSIAAQDTFRATVANLFSGMALLICAMLTLLSVQIVRLGLGEIRSFGIGIGLLAAAFLLYTLGSLLWIMKRYGQGGARVEKGGVDAPLTNGLADNAHWVWGVFFVDREDPSIMVEKRFGIGYTFNYGNPRAVAFMATFVTLLLGLIGVGLATTLL